MLVHHCSHPLVLGFAFTVALGLCPASWGDQIHLSDGTIIEGVFVGRDAEFLHYLDGDGQQQTLKRTRVARLDQTHDLDAAIEKKGKRLRERFHKQRQKAFEKQFSQFARSYRADAANEPDFIEIDGFSEAEQLPTLVRALCNPKRTAAVRRQRQLAARLLLLEAVTDVAKPGTAEHDPKKHTPQSGSPQPKGAADVQLSPDRVLACAIAAVVCPEVPLRNRAHVTAWRAHEELTLSFYEYVAAIPTEPAIRAVALDRIGSSGRLSSAGTLIAILTEVQVDTGASLARQLPSRFRPLTLGNTQLTVELPVVEVLSVRGTVHTTALNTVRGSAIGALEQLSGYSYGSDLKAWRRWHKRIQKAAESKPNR